MFEHSLISLDKKKRSGRRWLSLPIAVGLHLVALATFTFANYWHVESVSEPMVNTIFVTAAALPAPMIRKGGGAETQAAAQKPKVQPPAPSGSTQPVDVTAERPAVDPGLPSTSNSSLAGVPAGPGIPTGDPQGDPHGDPLGVPGMPFGGQGPGGGSQEAPPAADEPIRVTGAVTRPVLLDGPQPRYTEMARRAGVQGTVIVEAVIDEEGRVTHVKILKALPLGLDLSAVEAVKSWRFKPATLAGRPVKVYYTLTANFTLQR